MKTSSPNPWQDSMPNKHSVLADQRNGFRSRPTMMAKRTAITTSSPTPCPHSRPFYPNIAFRRAESRGHANSLSNAHGRSEGSFAPSAGATATQGAKKNPACNKSGASGPSAKLHNSRVNLPFAARELSPTTHRRTRALGSSRSKPPPARAFRTRFQVPVQK